MIKTKKKNVRGLYKNDPEIRKLRAEANFLKKNL